MWLYKKYYSNVTFDEKILTNGVRGAIMQFVNEVVSRKQTHTKNNKGFEFKRRKYKNEEIYFFSFSSSYDT